jgi:uncharacterized protein DUF3592
MASWRDRPEPPARLVDERSGLETSVLDHPAGRPARRASSRGPGPWLTLAGLLVLAVACAVAWSTLGFLGSASRAEGTVIALVQSTGAKGGRLYAPIVRFQTQAGAAIEFASKLNTDLQLYAPGQPVSVLYLREHPEEARIDTPLELWFVPLVLLIPGSVLFSVGLLVWRGSARRRRQPR